MVSRQRAHSRITPFFELLLLVLASKIRTLYRNRLSSLWLIPSFRRIFVTTKSVTFLSSGVICSRIKVGILSAACNEIYSTTTWAKTSLVLEAPPRDQPNYHRGRQVVRIEWKADRDRTIFFLEIQGCSGAFQKSLAELALVFRIVVVSSVRKSLISVKAVAPACVKSVFLSLNSHFLSRIMIRRKAYFIFRRQVIGDVFKVSSVSTNRKRAVFLFGTVL